MTPELRFEAFFREHYADLCRGVNRLIRDGDLAEDLVQEVFLRVWEKRSKLELDERFLFYLKKSCHHEALQLLRSQKPSLELSNELALTTDHSTDENILQKQLEESVLTSINKLPEKTRLIFTLSRYEEMTYKEIAHQLDISIKAVEKHMSKALKLMHDYLADFLTVTILIALF